MKREYRLPQVPADTEFTDLESVRSWHEQYAKIYRRKVARIEESALLRPEAKFPLLGTYQRKLAMHQSALKVLDSFLLRKAA